MLDQLKYLVLNAHGIGLLTVLVYGTLLGILFLYYVFTLARALHGELIDVLLQGYRPKEGTWFLSIHFIYNFVWPSLYLWAHGVSSEGLNFVLKFILILVTIGVNLITSSFLEYEGRRLWRNYRFSCWDKPWYFPFRKKLPMK